MISVTLTQWQAAFIAVGMLPLIWSALSHCARAFAARQQNLNTPDDREEKSALIVMLAPIALGAAFLIAARILPHASALPLDLTVDLHLPLTASPDVSVMTPASFAADWSARILAIVGAIYLAGLLHAVARLRMAQARIHRALKRSIAAPSGWDDDIRIISSGLPPFASLRGLVAIPEPFFAALPADQINLIVRHERAHVERGDPRYYLVLSWIDALLWFNPFVRAQTARCRLAAELACDASVIASAPQMRRTYAEAILSALKHTAGDALPCAPAVFSTRKHGEYRMRIASIMQLSPPPRKRRISVIALAATLGALPLGAAQFAYAFDAPDETASFATAILDGHLSSSFGERKDPFTSQMSFHNGVDIAAADGTPIKAPAAGKVLRAEMQLEGYGNMLEIDHGGGYVIRYGQVKSFSVKPGATVREGQTIALVGSSGRATGPHLHVEVYKDGNRIDPASLLVLPETKN